MTFYRRQKDHTEKHGHWIHEKRENKNSVTGYFILPACKCSVCGTWQPSERPKCLKCKAIMDETSK